MNHMIIIKGTKGFVIKSAMVGFLLVGVAGMSMAAQAWLSDAVTHGVESAQEPGNWADECLDYATRQGVDVAYCAPFLNPGEPAADPDPLDIDQVSLIASGFTYDATAQGTWVHLPDGSLLYVPIQRDACPVLTVYETDREWCINWADLSPGDDNG